MRKLLLAATALLGLTASAADSQTIIQNTFSGNECWNAGQGPGGPTTGFICSAQMRNGRAITAITGSGAATTTATNLQSTLYWTSAATTSWTVTTPAAPFDGEILTLGTTATLTTMVTLTANTGQSLAAAYNNQTLTANPTVQWQYAVANTTGYRMQ